MVESWPDIDRRRSGRIVQEALMCNLGEVVDLSKGGIRVRSKRPPGPPGPPGPHGRPAAPASPQAQTDLAFEGVTLPWKLVVEPIWTRVVDGDLYESGFRFVDLTEQQGAWLSEICMRYSLNRQLPDIQERD